MPQGAFASASEHQAEGGDVRGPHHGEAPVVEGPDLVYPVALGERTTGRLRKRRESDRKLPVVARTRSDQLGPAARPVAVPSDLDDPALLKASGIVELPFHIRWSEPSLSYDLRDRADRSRVYEQVLREGTNGDVRYFIDVDELLDLWTELVLPPAVRRAWAGWFRRHRSIELAC